MSSAKTSTCAFTLLDSDPMSKSIDDETYSRSVIRNDKKTYHQGLLVETFGDLKDCSIEMGRDVTMLDICLTDPEGKKWTVSANVWNREGTPMCITNVEIPDRAFDNTKPLLRDQ